MVALVPNHIRRSCVALLLWVAFAVARRSSLSNLRRRDDDCLSLSGLAGAVGHAQLRSPYDAFQAALSWCRHVAHFNATTIKNCPVCMPDCDGDTQRAFLHATIGNSSIVSFSLGGLRSTEYENRKNGPTTCMQFAVREKDGDVYSYLHRVGTYGFAAFDTNDEVGRFCAQKPMRYFARWLVSVSKALKISTIRGADESYFGHIAVSTHGLRLLTKGSSLYQDVFNVPGSEAAFEYDDKECVLKAQQLSTESTPAIRQKIGAVLELTRSGSPEEFEGKSPRGAAVMKAYESVEDAVDEAGLPSLADFNLDCDLFTADVAKANDGSCVN
eukprot:TRINITY_DN75481_c0_g1_i1.p1 TRINITY_DN75481_c0_g1~~TRINITY_DN75481_c0_g1_i1.p1  ORF type:complete len:335 (-),score=51.56 TRINITY_DN75481_c0_g1_i1:196-1179(-)